MDSEKAQGLFTCGRNSYLFLFIQLNFPILAFLLFYIHSFYLTCNSFEIINFRFLAFLALFFESFVSHHSMYIDRGKCGHLKAKWDNHPSCISCTACLRVSPCSICSNWTTNVWSLAEKRCLYSTRKWVMTQKRRQKKSKKTKSQSDLSDNGTPDGSTAPLSYIAQGRTHQGGSPRDLECDRALSPPVTGHPVTSQPITGQQSTGQLITSQLVTGQPITGQQSTGQLNTGQSVTCHPVTGQEITGHPVTGQALTGHPVTGHPVTGHIVTCQPGTSHQSFAYDFQNMPLQNYAPSISSHVSHGSICRLPNVHTPGYEHSEMSEFPNPATSSKQLIPLEPDFSLMSDPSVMIDTPISTDVSQTRPSRKEQSRRDHKSKKRRRRLSSSSSSSTSRSDSLNSSRRKKNSKRSKHSHKKRRR